MIGGAGSRHRRRRSSPGVHFAQAQQVARLAALNQRELGAPEGADGPDEAEFNKALARRRSSKYQRRQIGPPRGVVGESQSWALGCGNQREGAKGEHDTASCWPSCDANDERSGCCPVKLESGRKLADRASRRWG